MNRRRRDNRGYRVRGLWDWLRDLLRPGAPPEPEPGPDPPTPPEPTPPEPHDELDVRWVRLLNPERARASRSEVTHAVLVPGSDAQQWAEHMAATGRLYHDSRGVSRYGFGECVAYGYDDLESVLNGWLTSSGHRRILLDERYATTDIGVAEDARGRKYWCSRMK